MEELSSIAQRVGSVRPMVLSLLWLLFLRHVAADLPVAGTRSLAEARSHSERAAFTHRGVWVPRRRICAAACRPVVRNRPRTQGNRLYCLWRSCFVPAVFHLHPGSEPCDGRDESVEFWGRVVRSGGGGHGHGSGRGIGRAANR